VAYNPFSGTGTDNDPYIINSESDWNCFAAYVNGVNNFSGKFVKLTADISVSEMAGTSETYSFQGTFLGDGHTLTFTQGSSGSAFNEQYCAPFRYVNGATIRDLKTAGGIYTSKKFAAGLIAHSYGTTTITDCYVGIYIYSGYSFAGTHGGIVAMPEGNVTITGCAYTGRLLTNNGTNSCGGFVGNQNGKTITVTNSLYAPGRITFTWSAINDGATFVRGGSPTIDNCYYTSTLGAAQGTAAIAATTAPTDLSNLVEDYGMVKAYAHGILVGGTYYGVSAGNVSLADDDDNSTKISSVNGCVADVTLSGRTLYKDGAWNTICLPFNVTLAGSPLAGATARPLTSASITNEGTTLSLSFGDAVTTLVAGTPYIIKWESGDNIVNPVFNGVTIDKTDRSYDNGISGDERVRFLGTYKSTTFDAEDKSILLMGGGNTLYYPNAGAGIGAQRAYFKIGGDGALLARRLTAFNIDFGDDEATGIISVHGSGSMVSGSDAWYTLDGRRLSQKPSRAGVYIYKGVKVAIK
jgi:hypothetical protein